MKNLMIYISPTGSFNNPRHDLSDNDGEMLIKVQLENSLGLGWDKNDIMLVTNFPYKFKGIRAFNLKDVDFFDRKPQVSKINAIVKLFESGRIHKNTTYWFHDLDAFQLQKITSDEINIDEDEVAVTDFGGAKHFRGKDRFSGGVFFFKSGSYDIFLAIKKLCYELQIDEEEALGIICEQDTRLAKRIKKVDNAYNFIGYNLEILYQKVNKPIKVVHFHPRVGKKRLEGIGKTNSLLFFEGNNPIRTPLLTKKFTKILKKHLIHE